MVLSPINKLVNSTEKVHGSKANSRNIYCKAILRKGLCQAKLGMTGSVVTLILTDEFQTQ